MIGNITAWHWCKASCNRWNFTLREMRSLLHIVETPLQITVPILFHFCSAIVSLDIITVGRADPTAKLCVQDCPRKNDLSLIPVPLPMPGFRPFSLASSLRSARKVDVKILKVHRAAVLVFHLMELRPKFSRQWTLFETCPLH